jgi:hypothetical protein
MIKTQIKLNYEFVEYIPSHLKEETIYISTTFATASHKCCCGCGKEVVTPLSPTDWKLVFDGQSISLEPSIGNWSFDCQSHYWIKHNRVAWAPSWSKEEIKMGRSSDRWEKKSYFEPLKSPASTDTYSRNGKVEKKHSKGGFWSKMKKYW